MQRAIAIAAIVYKDSNAPAGVDDGQRSLDAGVQLLHGHGYKYPISGRQMNHPNIPREQKSGGTRWRILNIRRTPLLSMECRLKVGQEAMKMVSVILDILITILTCKTVIE